MPVEIDKRILAAKDNFAFETCPCGKVHALPECSLKTADEILNFMGQGAVKIRNQHFARTGESMRWCVVVSGFNFGGRHLRVEAKFEFKEITPNVVMTVMSLEEVARHNDLDKTIKSVWN